METEEVRERRDEEVEEKRKKAARSELSVETGASKLTSKAESNSYAGFNTLLYTWLREFQKLDDIFLSLLIFTRTTLICQISSAIGRPFSNIRVGERNIPTLCAV